MPSAQLSTPHCHPSSPARANHIGHSQIPRGLRISLTLTVASPTLYKHLEHSQVWPHWEACSLPDCRVGVGGVQRQLRFLPSSHLSYERVLTADPEGKERKIVSFSSLSHWYLPPMVASGFILFFGRSEVGAILLWKGQSQDAGTSQWP